MKIVFTDLDGTFLRNDNKISTENYNALVKLKKKEIITVAATGRNLFSAKKVLDNNLPFDYLIFSTGIAISDFKTKKIFDSREFNFKQTTEIASLLRDISLNFFMHFAAPENHNFFYNYVIEDSDFSERFKIYADFSAPLPNKIINICASQFVVVLPFDLNKYQKIRNKIAYYFPDVSIIRATSPLNNSHIWLEIYPADVNKGTAAKRLCKYLNIPLSKSFSIGNDYNDIALLEATEKSYVVKNAPEFIKKRFSVVASNEENGFCEAVKMLI